MQKNSRLIRLNFDSMSFIKNKGKVKENLCLSKNLSFLFIRKYTIAVFILKLFVNHNNYILHQNKIINQYFVYYTSTVRLRKIYKYNIPYSFMNFKNRTYLKS